jgi:hypothetical protein
LGINPVSGGKPLKDSRRIGIIIWYGLENIRILLELLLLVLFLRCKMMKIGQMISEYKRKYVIVMIGLFTAINLNIHPMWVIDE